MRKLILLRHGQSVWNKENKFTGWADVDLSAKGVEEALKAGELFVKYAITWDFAFTSYLKRAIRTLNIAAAANDLLTPKQTRSWRLNERHYGALQGLDKAQTAAKYGDEQVRIWRRSYDIPPPMLSPEDPRAPKFDKKYSLLDPSSLPLGESLKTTIERVIPFWQDSIAPLLICDKDVLIVAHGNSLRGLIKHIRHISDSEIPLLEIPTGIPQVFEMNKDLSVADYYYLK